MLQEGRWKGPHVKWVPHDVCGGRHMMWVADATLVVGGGRHTSKCVAGATIYWLAGATIYVGLTILHVFSLDH